MFIVFVGLVFRTKNVQFHSICSFIDPHSDSLQNGIVKPKSTNFLTLTINIKESQFQKVKNAVCSCELVHNNFKAVWKEFQQYSEEAKLIILAYHKFQHTKIYTNIPLIQSFISLED